MNSRIQPVKEEERNMDWTVLSTYRLICEALGYRTHWDSEGQTLSFVPALKGRTVYWSADDPLMKQLLQEVQRGLGNNGIELLPRETVSSPPVDAVTLRILSPARSPGTPRALIGYSPDRRGKQWAEALASQFRTDGFLTRTQITSNSPLTLTLRWSLRKGEEAEWSRRLAVTLTSGILRALTDNNLLSLFPLLADDTATALLSPIVKLNSAQTSHFTVRKEPRNSASESAGTAPSSRRADVVFNYRVFIPRTEGDPFLIFGDLHITNTGSEELFNPVICLHTSPANIQVGGQMIPSSLTAAMEVQGPDGSGTGGWQFIEEGGFKDAKKRGEHWIRSIRSLRIPPGKTETLSRCQIIVPRLERGQTATIQAVVYFNRSDWQVPSRNKIILSF